MLRGKYIVSIDGNNIHNIDELQQVTLDLQQQGITEERMDLVTDQTDAPSMIPYGNPQLYFD